jgi:hypothetical protein
VRQFIHGLSLPFHLALALRSDAEAWARYLRVAVLQSLVIVALGYACTDSAEEAVDMAQQRVQKAERAAAAESSAQDGPRRIKVEVDLAPDDLEEFEFWAALLATMQIVQWVVIALSRDYHDAISRDVSLLTRIEPEDGPLTPRLRLHVGWLAKKFSRRVRAFIVMVVAIPAVLVFTIPLGYTSATLAVLGPPWVAYWLVVFTTAKSARSWEDTSGRAPWFLRAWTWLTTRVPGLRWGVLQAYGRFWANRTRSVFSPAVETEKQPWAFAGLAVIRALAFLPVFKSFLRPLIPVAAAHLVLAQRSIAPPAPSEPSALPGEPGSGSTASAA